MKCPCALREPEVGKSTFPSLDCCALDMGANAIIINTINSSEALRRFSISDMTILLRLVPVSSVQNFIPALTQLQVTACRIQVLFIFFNSVKKKSIHRRD